LTAAPADGRRSPRRAAPLAAARTDHPHFPGRISSAQRPALHLRREAQRSGVRCKRMLAL